MNNFISYWMWFLFCDINGVLCLAPHKYIDKMVQSYITMFVINPKQHKSVRPPLEQGNTQEIDT